MKEYDLLCIGNALIDVFALSDGEAFKRFSLDRPVQHIDVEKLKDIIKVLKASSIDKELTISSGGGAANVAKIAGFLGAKVRFTGSVGAKAGVGILEAGQSAGQAAEPDYYGKLFKKDLAAAGVELHLAVKQSPTGLCLYLESYGGMRAGNTPIDRIRPDSIRFETRIAASPSAALELSVSDINDDDIKKVRVVLIDGFLLDKPDLVRHILKKAKQYGAVAALDLSSVSIAEKYAIEILDYTTRFPLILFMNNEEAEAFYGALASLRKLLHPDKTDASSPLFDTDRRKTNRLFRQICSFFQSETGKTINRFRHFPVIVIKRGPEGAFCFADGDIHRIKTSPVEALDSVGAGDAFCAGFLSAWVRRWPVLECANFGNKTARVILDVNGTQANSGMFSELAARLR